MGIFNKFKKSKKSEEVTKDTKKDAKNETEKNKEMPTSKEFKIAAPIKGTLIPITEVPDPVFAEKILGDGFAIIPNDDGIVCSPINGKVVQVFETKHAVTLIDAEGMEVLIHFGVNTVQLEGEGFTSHIKADEEVKVGTKLIEADLKVIREKASSDNVIVVFTSSEQKFNVVKKEVETGEILSLL